MESRPQGKPTLSKAQQTGKSSESPWNHLSATALEADLAYFNARLEWIGEPKTSNQKAQRDTFLLLVPAMGKILSRLKRKAPVKP